MVEEVEAEGPPLKLSQLQRFQFLEFRLLWEGRVNRRGLTNAFQISEQQASLDLGRYREIAPENLVYDGSQKTYRRGAKFVPRYVEELTDRYLLQMLAISTGRFAKEESWFDELPASSVAHLPGKPTDWRILADIAAAIRDGAEIDVEYLSLTQGSDRSKRVAPHALGHGSGRWHMRAWNVERQEFRDYLLDRVEVVGASRKSDVDPACDKLWTETFALRIAPNPLLKPDVRAAIERERRMKDGELVCELPLSMCFYLVHDHQLDLIDKVKWGDGADGTVSPSRLQLVLLNMQEYKAAVARAKAATAAAIAGMRKRNGNSRA